MILLPVILNNLGLLPQHNADGNWTLQTQRQMAHLSEPVRESRRSTRVPLKVVIKTQGITKPLTCDGETIIVNIHGALISTTVALTEGMRVEIQVYLTGKRSQAQVVYIDPNHPLHCGIALAKPENIWGVSLPPDDWSEDDEGA